MKRRTVLAAAAAASGTLLAGCGGEAKEDIEDPDVTVTIARTDYDPVRVSIDPGQAVEWVNESEWDHTVSSYGKEYSESWDFDEPLELDSSLGYRFEEEGVYLYRCTVHTRQSMCGAVLVGDVSLDETLPCE